MAITRQASKQTYYTIRWFVDRQRVGDAYRAYGYFRWLDDLLDSDSDRQVDQVAILQRQQAILQACYRGVTPGELSAEELMLYDLVQSDPAEDSGLHTYLQNMMAVMRFDVARRGRVISQDELSEYTRLLASAVSEALYYFIGNSQAAAGSETRYLAVSAAHITHMLRDSYEDTLMGYYNIPGEFLDAHQIAPQDLESEAYRAWVRRRVELAGKYFQLGRAFLAQSKSLRCRMAGYAYTARFEWVLKMIRSDGYRLRRDYAGRKSLRAGLWIGWSTLVGLLTSHWRRDPSRYPTIPSIQIDNP
jgi:hypothetical protein